MQAGSARAARGAGSRSGALLHNAAAAPSSTLVPEPCILCGCLLLYSMEKRYKKLQDLASLLQKMCVATPYVHQHIINAAKEETILSTPLEGRGDAPCPNKASRQVPCCIACINWVRRLDIACMKLGMRRDICQPLKKDENVPSDTRLAASMPQSSGRRSASVDSSEDDEGGYDDDGNEGYSSSVDLQIDESDCEETAGIGTFHVQAAAGTSAEMPISSQAGLQQTQGGQYRCTCCTASSLHSKHKHARCLSKNLLIIPLDNLLLFLETPSWVCVVLCA